MKIRTYVLMGSLVLILSASGTKKVKSIVGVNPGDIAPRIELLEDKYEIGFQNNSGKYTLLNFWAAYDAESRARNVRLSNELSKSGSDKVVMVSFSLDEIESVFTETVKADKLNNSMQYFDEQGRESELYKTFNRKGKFGSFLINDEGVIVATNVTPDKLTQVLNAN